MVLFPVLIFGVFFPLQAGRGWIENPVFILSFAWLPLLFVSAMTSDSFAGERERHTLETLLASRLSDSSILIGKIVSAMSYGLLVTALIVFAGVIAVNVVHGHGDLLFYPVKSFFTGIVLCVLIAGLISCIGVLVSLRASTVRQAHQTMSIAIVVVALLPSLLIGILPGEMKKTIFTSLNSINMTVAIVIVVFALTVVVAVVFYMAMKRFNRMELL